MALETVGSSAYLGAAGLISDKGILETAAVSANVFDRLIDSHDPLQSILTVESRQAAWVSSAVLKGSAWNGPFETPLSMDGVFSIACTYHQPHHRVRWADFSMNS